MKNDGVVLRVMCAMMVQGERVEVGATLKLPALAAADLLDTGKVMLAHQGDMSALIAARQEHVRRCLVAERRPTAPPEFDVQWAPR